MSEALNSQGGKEVTRHQEERRKENENTRVPVHLRTVIEDAYGPRSQKNQPSGHITGESILLATVGDVAHARHMPSMY